jgi:hypothetical protein
MDNGSFNFHASFRIETRKLSQQRLDLSLRDQPIRRINPNHRHLDTLLSDLVSLLRALSECREPVQHQVLTRRRPLDLLQKRLEIGLGSLRTCADGVCEILVVVS